MTTFSLVNDRKRVLKESLLHFDYTLVIATMAVALLAKGGATLDPARCVAIEDSLWGIASARAAGLKVAAVTTSYDREALSGAHQIASGVGELTLDLLEDLATQR